MKVAVALSQPTTSLSFLLSQSTLLCIAIRLSIIFGILPKSVKQWLEQESFQSLFIRSVVIGHYDFEYLDGKQAWQGHLQSGSFTLLLKLCAIFADLATAISLRHLGNWIRRQQNQDNEEDSERNMPKVIQAPFAVFASRENDSSSLFSRNDAANLSACVYFWGTTISSSATNEIYSGLRFAFVNLMCRSSIPSDPFVPIFLFPIILAFRNNRAIVGSLLMVIMYYYIVTVPLFRLEIPTFSTPNLGVQWYFSMQVFERFRHYFAIMFLGLRFVLVLPLCVRFQHMPVELFTCLWFVYMLFHVCPTVTDFMVGLSLLLLSPRSMRRMGVPSLVALCALPVPLGLYILDWYT